MLRRALATSLLPFALACSGSPAQPVELLQSNKPRDTTAVTSEQIATAAAATRHFGVSLYKQLAPSKQNLFFSPHSIASSLLLTYAGARTNTASEMRSVLGLTRPDAETHAAAGALDLALASRAKYGLDVVNALWGQTGATLLPEFLDVLAIHYGAGMHIVDFAKNHDGSRQAINQWVEQQTEGTIRDLMAPGSVTASTRLVLTNAVYFNATWTQPFPHSETQKRPFTTATGATVSVPTLSGPIGDSSLYLGATVTAVAIPYQGEAFSLIVIQPEDLAAFEAGLDGAALDQILDGLQRTAVNLRMPKWQLGDASSLKPALVQLGITSAFGSADFSGIDGTQRLQLDDVVHKAFVFVDEVGTRAAAATGTTIVLQSGVVGPFVDVSINRAFVYLIRDNATGAVLFFGRVVDPTL